MRTRWWLITAVVLAVTAFRSEVARWAESVWTARLDRRVLLQRMAAMAEWGAWALEQPPRPGAEDDAERRVHRVLQAEFGYLEWQDCWGRRLVVGVHGERVVIRSAGPDGEFGNDDDLHVRSSLP